MTNSNMTDKNLEQDLAIINSEEYKKYLAALCRLASQYISSIRVQFAEKAYEKYQDETLRRIVYAYGEEIAKLDEARLRDFSHAAHFGAYSPDSLADSCLNNACHYGPTIKMLFDIG